MSEQQPTEKQRRPQRQAAGEVVNDWYNAKVSGNTPTMGILFCISALTDCIEKLVEVEAERDAAKRECEAEHSAMLGWYEKTQAAWAEYDAAIERAEKAEADRDVIVSNLRGFFLGTVSEEKLQRLLDRYMRGEALATQEKADGR